jgi:hypothetical protein
MGQYRSCVIAQPALAVCPSAPSIVGEGHITLLGLNTLCCLSGHITIYLFFPAFTCFEMGPPLRLQTHPLVREAVT